MTFEEAKALLTNCNRNELRDHAFGDREIYFTNGKGEGVAEGYVSSVGDYSIEVGKNYFGGKEAKELLELGHKGAIERNDATGPDDYREGETLPGLTLDGVSDELCNKH